MLIDEIKKANIEAMKAHDQNKRAILSIIVNKYMLLNVERRSEGKEVEDSDVLAIIQKTMKELEDEKKGYLDAGRPESASNIDIQAEAISCYLPRQLSEEDIRLEISKLDDKSMPSIMKHFKANFQGQVDMGLVSRIAKGI